MKNIIKIFIPFMEGILNYDCRECGYACCERGYLVMNTREKKMLLKNYPSLRYFFVRETEKTYQLTKYMKCWFIENSGLCSIQKKYGYSSKPLICRLHPFYLYRCNDEYVAISENCRTLRVNGGNKNSSYKLILKNAKEAIDNGVISGEIDWSRKRLNLEKEILDASKAFLNKSSYLDFAVHQISITTKDEDIKRIRLDLLESLELWRSFLEINDLDIANKILTYELTAITSLLRVESFHLRQIEAGKIPLALLSLYFYMILLSKDRRIKTYVETYRQVLSDVALGLSYLEKDDLKIKGRSIESKVKYLRSIVKVIHTQLIDRAKKQKNKDRTSKTRHKLTDKR